MNVPAARDARRDLLIARIGENRSELRLSLQSLQKPVQSLERWHGGLVRLWPVLPLILAVVVLAWVLVRLLGRSGSGGPQARPLAWGERFRQLLSAIRLAMQCYALLQMASPPSSRVLEQGAQQ